MVDQILLRKLPNNRILSANDVSYLLEYPCLETSSSRYSVYYLQESADTPNSLVMCAYVGGDRRYIRSDPFIVDNLDGYKRSRNEFETRLKEITIGSIRS